MTLSYDFIQGRYFIEDIHILRGKKSRSTRGGDKIEEVQVRREKGEIRR
jgi:hypothetical protein